MSCPRVSRIFSEEIATKHEKNRVSENPPIRAPVETLARCIKITQLIISHAMRARLPRRIQRASPIPPRQEGEEYRRAYAKRYKYRYPGARRLPNMQKRGLLYTSPSPRDRTRSRMPSSA